MVVTVVRSKSEGRLPADERLFSREAPPTLIVYWSAVKFRSFWVKPESSNSISSPPHVPNACLLEADRNSQVVVCDGKIRLILTACLQDLISSR